MALDRHAAQSMEGVGRVGGTCQCLLCLPLDKADDVLYEPRGGWLWQGRCGNWALDGCRIRVEQMKHDIGVFVI